MNAPRLNIQCIDDVTQYNHEVIADSFLYDTNLGKAAESKRLGYGCHGLGYLLRFNKDCF